ncbi:hypothetical protein [Demetria terragena]|uniref:hypothetical protein n=1 Tax=Demetria terragena TaxID=63959 RepID=UPI00036E3A24|nr:hypothetical protein [Demetria terragena]
MTTRAQVRKAALALPEVEEGTQKGMSTFAVRGKRFAAVTTDGQVQLSVTTAEAEEIVTTYTAAATVTRGASVVGVRVPLADINGMALNHWVRRAWFYRAPRRVADGLAHADRADSGSGDLPTAIGRPATRALLGAGITSLDDLTRRTRRQVADLHGVGPKAIRLLEDELVDRGSSFRA